MGHVTGALSSSRADWATDAADRRRGRAWVAVGLGLCLLAAAVAAGAQSIWDDPAFQLLRQAMDALNDGKTRAGRRAGRRRPSPSSRIIRSPTTCAGRPRPPSRSGTRRPASFAKAAELYPGLVRGPARSRRVLRAPRQAQGVDAGVQGRARHPRPGRPPGAHGAHARRERRGAGRAWRSSRSSPRATARSPRCGPRSAVSRTRRGDWAGAEKAYAKAVALKDDGRNWFNLGVVRVRLKDLPGALKAFEQAGQDPDRQEAGGYRGRPRPRGDEPRERRRPASSVPPGSSPYPPGRAAVERPSHRP